MMWDDGDDLVAGPPGDAAADAAATAARDEVTQLVAGLDDGRKEALKSLLARSANGTAPDSLGHDVRSILSASLSHSTDSFAGGAGHLHVLIDDPAHAFDPSTLQYLREAMLSDGGGGGGGLEPMSISGKSDRSDAVRWLRLLCAARCSVPLLTLFSLSLSLSLLLLLSLLL